MAQHLENGTCSTYFSHHQQSKQYQAAVTYRRIGIDVFQIGLYHSTESTVYN